MKLAAIAALASAPLAERSPAVDQRSGFLLAKEKSPDRRVPGLALPYREIQEMGRAARRDTNY